MTVLYITSHITILNFLQCLWYSLPNINNPYLIGLLDVFSEVDPRDRFKGGSLVDFERDLLSDFEVRSGPDSLLDFLRDPERLETYNKNIKFLSSYHSDTLYQ